MDRIMRIIKYVAGPRTLTLPRTATIVSSGAFAYSTGLLSVVVNKDLEWVEAHAFAGAQLWDLWLPSSL